MPVKWGIWYDESLIHSFTICCLLSTVLAAGETGRGRDSVFNELVVYGEDGLQNITLSSNMVISVAPLSAEDGQQGVRKAHLGCAQRKSLRPNKTKF